MTVQELEARITHAEFVEWAAFYRLEPWGCEVEDGRTAMQCAASVAPYSKSRVRPQQFMPDRERESRRINTAEGIASTLAMFAQIHPGLIRHQPNGGEVDCQTEHQP